MNDPLDDRLPRLDTGDQAVEQAFRTFEPYLRKAARRYLPPLFRSKFDSADVIQSVWTDLLRGFREAGWCFQDADQLRGFLYVATRNRVLDRIRQHRRAVQRHVALGDDGPERPVRSALPSPSELVQVEELWERIVARCPAEHRPILSLRRQGYSVAEIAAQTGLHADSVRRILRTLARQLAFEGPTA